MIPAWGLLAAMTLIGATAVQQAPPIATTVCALDADPEAFEGKRVTLAALLDPDGHAGWWLRDHACRENAVVPREAEAKRPTLEALTRRADLVPVIVAGTARACRGPNGRLHRAGLVIEDIGPR